MKKCLKRVMALFMTSSLLLSGCGAAESADDRKQETEGTETVELTVWGEKDNTATLTKMIDSFKEQYKGQADFNITLETQADSGVRDVMLTDVHGGADVFSFPDDQLISLVAGGVLVPVPNAEEVSAENIKESVDAATLNGKLYGYPMTADNGYFMYYNKNYFSDSDVATLDGMLDIAGANGKYLTMDWSSGWYLYSFFGNTGLDFGVNDDGVTNHCNWNAIITDIKGVDIAQAMLDIAAKPGFKNCVQDDFIAGVQDGSIIAGVSGCWNAAKIKELWGDDYGAVKLPTYTCAGQQIQMSSFKGYKYMAVNAYTKYPEWANKLAQWFTNEDNQKLRFEMKNVGPANKAAAADDAVKKVPAIMAVMDQAQYGKLQRVGNSYWDAATEFGEKMAAGNPDNTDLQEIMDNFVAGITQSVAE